MKKFVIIVTALVAMYIGWDFAYYRLGFYIDFHPEQQVTTFIRTEGDSIYLNKGSGYEKFEIKGVNMGSSEPGQWSTDFDIDKETYKRWFQCIQEMGANTVRVYMIQAEDFYEAFYEYNSASENPLYLIQGVWVNDYVNNSYRDAYHEDIYQQFVDDCKVMIDVIHGERKISLGRAANMGSGTFQYDVSPWVIGYILGIDWDDGLVAYTNEKYRNNDRYCSFSGEYLYTTEEGTAFEAMLARVGDQAIAYESKRYKQQRIFAFSNWPITDPFRYTEKISEFFYKGTDIDVEHIRSTDKVIAGQFASYHVFPYFPDYFGYIDDLSPYGIEDKKRYMGEDGNINSYYAYISALKQHHEMPVVIAEFGVPTGRGIAQAASNTGRNQGYMSEHEQGQALLQCYEDIMSAGCAGSIVYSWQDEWIKRSWNTLHQVDLKRSPYWSDDQTSEQHFGLLSFDPGEDQSVCYVDGDISEWTQEDVAAESDELTLSVKYDEKYIYFMIHKDGLNFEEDCIFIPIDTTPKTGSSYCKNYDVMFDRAADFLLILNGQDNSRVVVQERYEALRSTYAEEVYNFNTYAQDYIPDVNSPEFVNIDLLLSMGLPVEDKYRAREAATFETGKLTYGNANPEAEDFNSLADFICKGDYIEVKLPWQLLNFADPSRMEILDDYYNGNYGVDYINIDQMYVGVGDTSREGRIHLSEVELKGWKDKVTYHERLKQSYGMMKERWTGNEKIS